MLWQQADAENTKPSLAFFIEQSSGKFIGHQPSVAKTDKVIHLVKKSKGELQKGRY
jgi:hypothetical protein